MSILVDELALAEDETIADQKRPLPTLGTMGSATVAGLVEESGETLMRAAFVWAARPS